MKSISGLLVCTLLSGVCSLFLPQQHHPQAGLHSPHQYYDPDMRMPCSFERKPKSKVAKHKLPAPAPSAVGGMGPSRMARPYVDPDVVADQIDTMQDMAVGHRNPHSAQGYAAYPPVRPAAPAAMPAGPAAAPAAMPAAPAAVAPGAAPSAAAAAKTMFRPQSPPVTTPTVDFFSSLFDYGGFGMVKRHATQGMHHAGNQAYRCMCVPSTDIDGNIYAALRSGRPNPMAEERINAHGKCPMGRTCLCPNLGHGWR